VALTAASNAVGTRPTSAPSPTGRTPSAAVVHVDGVHATPHLATDVRELGADLYATSGLQVVRPARRVHRR
jgi:selenocysteine lyase/cysteine desulfurase